MNRKKHVLQVFFVLLMGAVMSLARSDVFFDRSAGWQDANNQSTAFIAAGLGQGEANELVYSSGRKLSQLIWETQSLPMLLAGMSSRSGKVGLNLQGQVGITEGEAVMDDYDWQHNSANWSDWSHHEDTDVTAAWSWDINMDFSLYTSQTTRLAWLLGYKQELWAWESRGGSYIYSSSGNLRDQSGTFTAGQPVISYEQRFSAPYLGFRLATQTTSWKFHARYIYSNQVDVEAIDHHYLRNLIFEDDFADGEMQAYAIGAQYRFNNQMALLLRYAVQEYEEVRGDTIYRNANTGAITGYCTDCAGADNRSEIWSLGLNFTF